MYKIEITAETLAELSGKVLSLASKLMTGTATEGLSAPKAAKVEVAEAAPPPKPQASSTKSSTPAEITSNGHPNDQSVLEKAKSSDLSSPTTAPESAPIAEVTESQPTTPEVSSTTAPVVSVTEDEELEVVDLPIAAPEVNVRDLVLSVVEKRGKPFMEEILSRFGAAKASLVDPALRPELIDLCNEALSK